MSKTDRLYRSQKEKIIGGVCGGLADYFSVDPVIIRLIFVLLFFFHGIGLIAYIIMLIIVPKEDDVTFKAKNFESQEEPEIVDAEIIDDEDEKKEDDNFSSAENNYADKTKNEKPAREKYDGKSILGISLVLIGGIILLERIFPVITFKLIVPIVLIGAGLYFLIDNNRRGSRNENQ